MHPIKEFCKENKIKVKDLSKTLDINAVYLSQIISGYRRPSPDLALKIQIETGIDAMRLLYPGNEKAA